MSAPRRGHDDLLVRGTLERDDRVRVQPLARGRLDAVGAYEQGDEQPERGSQHPQRDGEFPRADDVSQQEQCHHRGGGHVDDAGGRGAADHSQLRQQDERPHQAADQRAQVVGRVQVGQHPSGVGGPGCAAALQQGHQQRNLGADQAHR